MIPKRDITEIGQQVFNIPRIVAAVCVTAPSLMLDINYKIIVYN